MDLRVFSMAKLPMTKCISVQPNQGRRLHGARGTCPHFVQMAGHGGTVSRVELKKNERNKLAKLYCPSREHSRALTKTTNCICKAKTNVKGNDKKLFRASCRTCSPHFQIRSGATEPNSNWSTLPLSCESEV